MKKSLISIGMLVLMINVVNAQSLPAPTRNVYKCEVGGKITYSDDPCEGAKRLQVEPSRGLNKSTGRELLGKDVAEERRREQLAEAVKPLTGMTVEQFGAETRRTNLSSAAKRECALLDRDLPALERRESLATGESKDEVQRKLFDMRKRFRELRC
jgi:hypothetical protein